MEHLDPRIVRTREAVLDAATALLVEGGPDAVTMDGVVQRSGVAKSTIYRHWSGRDELLTEVFDHNAPHIDTPPVELGFREALEYVMARSASSTGFSVRWIMACGFTFLTCHRSVALFGPKNWWAAPSFQP